MSRIWGFGLLVVVCFGSGLSSGVAQPPPRPDNETVIIVPTRLTMVSEVDQIDLTVSREFKDGEDEVRVVDPRDVPPGRSIVDWLRHVSEQMESAGFVRRPAEAADGHQVWEFVREARVIARFRSKVSITGTGKVTQALDVAVDLEKPAWASVRAQTRVWFAEDVPQQRQLAIRAAYKRWVSASLDRFIAQNERSPVVLEDTKKEALRQPRRATVSQSRPAPIEGGSEGTLTVNVTSQVIDRRLGVN